MPTLAEMLALEETQPIPPRWRGVKRITLGVLAALVLLVLLRLGWGWEAQRRLDAKIAALRAAGEPVLPEDFERPPIPSDQNAAVLYKEAIALQGTLTLPWVTTPDGRTVSLYLGDTENHRELLTSDASVRAQCLAAYAKVFALCSEARERTSCDWGLQPPATLAAMTAIAGVTSDQRHLGRALLYGGLCEHWAGNDAAALERLRDALALARRIPDPSAAYLSYFVAQPIDGLVVSRVEEVCRALAVEGAASGLASGNQPAAHRQIEALIDELLDDTALTDGWASAWQGDRSVSADLLCMIARGGPLPLPRVPASIRIDLMRLLMLPQWLSAGAESLRDFDRIRSSGQAAHWREAQARLPVLKQPSTLDRKLCFPWLFSAEYVYDHAAMGVGTHFVSLARRRMAAIALAMRMYEIDHGQRPQELAELVPEYLPELPLDPFTSPPVPFHYVPDGPWPALYSVGQNGVDDGGIPPPRRGPRDWNQGDIPFSLDGRDGLRRTPPEP